MQNNPKVNNSKYMTNREIYERFTRISKHHSMHESLLILADLNGCDTAKILKIINAEKDIKDEEELSRKVYVPPKEEYDEKALHRPIVHWHRKYEETNSPKSKKGVSIKIDVRQSSNKRNQ